MIKKIKPYLKIIPHKPGCYLWKDKNNKVIYVGKAKDLVNRIKQYFVDNFDYKSHHLFHEIDDLDYIIVESENDALILEDTLIKKYQPKYNVLLKDTKGYPYIIVTDQPHPKLVYSHNRHKYHGIHYGPFATSDIKKYDLYRLLQQIFPLRKCNTIGKKTCIYYDIGQCLAPCVNKISPEVYSEILKKIDNLFHGQTKEIIQQLFVKEKEAAHKMDFRSAQKCKDLITSLEQLSTNQNVILSKKKNIDFVGSYYQDGVFCIVVFQYLQGHLMEKIQQHYYCYDEQDQSLCQWMTQYYTNCLMKPQIIYAKLDEMSLNFFRQKISATCINPLRGQKRQILSTAIDNAKAYWQNYALQCKKTVDDQELVIEQIKQMFDMTQCRKIVVFDVAHLFNECVVGASICWLDGDFCKEQYRKYNIRSHKLGDNDRISEIVSRYFDHCEEKPDLVIIDGGQIQVEQVKKDLHLEIPIIGLIKDQHHTTNKIYFSGEKITLDQHSPIFLFFKKLQDEVHRFAIRFYRLKKEKKIFEN